MTVDAPGSAAAAGAKASVSIRSELLRLLEADVTPGDDNAVVETFFKTLMAELIWRSIWQTRRQVESALFEYINGFYNPRRRHSTLGGKSPLAFEKLTA